MGVKKNVPANPLKIDLQPMSGAISKYQCLDEVDRKWWTGFIEEFRASFESPALELEQWLLLKVKDIVENAPITVRSTGQT